MPPMALNFESKHTGLGLAWHYILSLNIPVWASNGTTFEPKHTDMGLPWHFFLSLNIPDRASHGTSF